MMLIDLFRIIDFLFCFSIDGLFFSGLQAFFRVSDFLCG